MKGGTHEQAQAKLVEDWNRDFQVGTEVVSYCDEATIFG